MQPFLDQATHNQAFHDAIEATFIGKFSDWKNTVLFYVAIHWMKGLAASRGIHIGSTHQEIEQNVNPDRHNAKMRISKGAWLDYKSLYRYSQISRYDGYGNAGNFEKLRSAEHSQCLIHLQNFKKYLLGQGLPI